MDGAWDAEVLLCYIHWAITNGMVGVPAADPWDAPAAAAAAAAEALELIGARKAPVYLYASNGGDDNSNSRGYAAAAAASSGASAMPPAARPFVVAVPGDSSDVIVGRLERLACLD